MPRILPGSGGSASTVSDSAVATQVTSGTQTQAALRAAYGPGGTAGNLSTTDAAGYALIMSMIGL